MTHTDQVTGEISDDIDQTILVPLHIAALSEEHVSGMMPSPVQVVGALLIARERLARAPEVLENLSKELRAKKRDLTIARAMSFIRFRNEGWSIADARELVATDTKVVAAVEVSDEAEIALAYGRDLQKSLDKDIELLRSINSNFREEIKR